MGPQRLGSGRKERVKSKALVGNYLRALGSELCSVRLGQGRGS